MCLLCVMDSPRDHAAPCENDFLVLRFGIFFDRWSSGDGLTGMGASKTYPLVVLFDVFDSPLREVFMRRGVSHARQCLTGNASQRPSGRAFVAECATMYFQTALSSVC